MLTKDANTQNTRGTCAHTHETQAIIACDLTALHLFPTVITKQNVPNEDGQSVELGRCLSPTMAVLSIHVGLKGKYERVQT